MEYLNQLNEAQRSAVKQINGPILILAGAGAGKTKTITYRILNLIKKGVDPSSILAVTFTNKASKEMSGRIEELLKEDSQLNFPVQNNLRPFISTFHSLGVHIIKENAHKLNLTKYFNIFDKNDSKRAIKEALIQLDINPKQYEPAKVLNIISKQKGNLITHSNFEKKVGNEFFAKIISDVWNKYEKILQKEKALDFDDLLLKTALLLKQNEDIRTHYQNIWKYIHIDEYQDTNKAQYEISKLLAQKNKNICVVGDADQNIYSWRGADIQNILNFEKDFKNTKTIILEENYRSTQNILTVANSIIKKNKIRKEKNLFTKNEEGEKISIISSYNETTEANTVAKKTKELINKGFSPSEMVVLYRANFQSRALEEAFLTENVPYQVLGTKFFERKEIKDIISFIKASLNPESLTDIKRIINIPPRGIGGITILKLFSGKEKELSPMMQIKVQKFQEMMKNIKEVSLNEKPSEVIKFIMKETGIEKKLEEGIEEDKERLDNIKEFVTLATKYDSIPIIEGLEKLLEDAALASDQDEIDEKEKRDAVKLMTVHASKGLEFDFVFITGLEDTLFPSKRGRENTEAQKEEERRLFYVALTRARKKLFLSYTSVRTIFGSRQMNTPSEFILDIDDNLLENENIQENSNNGEKVIYLEW